MRAITRERLIAALTEVPRLADLAQSDDPRFAERVQAWLAEHEQQLGRAATTVASLMATERAAIASAGDAEGSRGPGQRRRRRALVRATTTTALKRAEEALRGEVDRLDAELDTARELLGRAVGIYAVRKPAILNVDPSVPGALAEVWASLRDHPEVTHVIQHLAVMLPRSDREFILTGLLLNASGA